MTCKASSHGPSSIAWTPELPDVHEDSEPSSWAAWDLWVAYHAGELALLTVFQDPAGKSVSGHLV